MVARHLHMPHRIACVTDFDGLPSHIERIEPPRDFENVRIPTWGADKPQCLRRLAMFAPDAAERFGERMLCMDLDVVIKGDITPMVTHDAFRIAKGTAPSRPYNGSMILLTAGARSKVYQDFTPDAAAKAGQRYLGSDQAWIAWCLGPEERTWDDKDGLCWFNGPRIADPRIMFFPGGSKPWKLAQLGNEAVARHYRGERKGRCLVLGYDRYLWADVAREIEKPFEAVIASPEAAEHWPGQLLAVADTNEEAVRLAQMYGFDEIVRCGMREAI